MLSNITMINYNKVFWAELDKLFWAYGKELGPIYSKDTRCQAV